MLNEFCEFQTKLIEKMYLQKRFRYISEISGPVIFPIHARLFNFVVFNFLSNLQSFNCIQLKINVICFTRKGIIIAKNTPHER